jgi:ABC-type sugar transport system substrate-binding protein
MKCFRLALVLSIGAMLIFPIATVLAGGAGEKTPALSKQKVVIGVSPKMKGAPYWDTAGLGAVQAGKDLGIDVIVQSPTMADATLQSTIIDDFITRGVNALVVAANDETALIPVLQRATKQGILIITYDSDVPNSARKYMVHASGTVDIGRRLGELLIKDMGTSGKVAIMTGGLGALNLNQHIQGAKEILAKYPGIEIVKTVASGDDQQQAFINAENLLKSYPDLKGIIGVAAGEPPAACEAVTQAGKAGQIAIVGLITPNSVKKYFQSNVMKDGLLWDPAALTYAAVKVANMLLQGQSPKDGDILYPGGSPIKIDGAYIFSGTTTFTPENIGNFNF